MDQSVSTPAMETLPCLDVHLEARRHACMEQLYRTRSVMERLVLLHDCLAVAPVLQFEAVLVEPVAERPCYRFEISIPVMRGDAELLQYPLDPTYYKSALSNDLVAGTFCAEGDYLIVGFETRDTQAYWDATYRHRFLTLALETVKTRARWVENEAAEHNAKVRHFFMYLLD
jgi:hypothetical protein